MAYGKTIELFLISCTDSNINRVIVILELTVTYVFIFINRQYYIAFEDYYCKLFFVFELYW